MPRPQRPASTASMLTHLRNTPPPTPNAIVLIGGQPTAAGPLATTSPPSPRATSTTGQGLIVERSGRIEPPSPHAEVGGRKTPRQTKHGHGSRPSGPGPPPA